MKKLATIQPNHNSLSIELEGPATYVSISTKSGKLIRHSKTKGKNLVVFNGKEDDYIIETDGKIKNSNSNNRTNLTKPKATLKVKKASENGIKSIQLNGVAFNVKKIQQLTDQGVFDAKTLKASLSAYYDVVEKKAKAEILTDDLVKEATIGTITAAKKNQIKKQLDTISKEKVRVKKLVEKTTDISKLIIIKTKFPTINKI